MSKVRIELLRGVAAGRKGSAALPRRLLEIVCFLALRRRAVSRGELAASVWPDLDPDASSNAFHVTLHRLRQWFCGFEVVTHGAAGYALSSQVVLDLTELEQLAAKIRGFHVLSADEAAAVQDGYRQLASIAPFESLNEGLAPLDTRCRHLGSELAERLAVHRLRTGETAAALSLAETMLDLDSCDEAGWEIVIRSHISDNRRADAVRAFHRYSIALERELGLPPSDHLRRLVRDPLAAARKPSELASALGGAA